MERADYINTLKQQYGARKEIPLKYEPEILAALSHYPELKDIRIRFVLTASASVPYGTKPTLASCFLPPSRRTYTVTILEEAESPEKEALFRNLSKSMRIGVIAHELVHVIQYHRCRVPQLLKMLALYLIPFWKRQIERAADKGAIDHGYGLQLLQHACYIREIPGYVHQRPEINKDYLKPDEIRHFLRHRG